MDFKLYTDGGARGNPGPAGCGAILFDTSNNLVWFENKYINSTTNNQAEYEALLMGLKMAQQFGVESLECFLDSELAVKQINGEYKVKNLEIKNIKDKVDIEIKKFKTIKFTHVRREYNKFADKLVNLALDNALHL